MGDTITLSQTPDAEKLIIYPNGTSSSAWSRVGGSANYQAVDDDTESPNDDTDYIHMTTNTLTTDRYGFDNHGTEAGTINFIRMFSRAKAITVPQSSSGVFREVVYNNPTYYEGTNHAPLTLGYNNYSTKWETRPWDSVAWTWTNIDDLLGGLRATSPTVTGQEITLVIRPTGAGDITQLTKYGDSTNWECVDETSSTGDSDTTYVHAPSAAWFRDLYNLTDHTTQTGTITKVVVYVRAKSRVYRDDDMYIFIKTGGTEYFSPIFNNISLSYTLHSHEWTDNPNTSSAWTWATASTGIDDLQAGVKLNIAGSSGGRCTQLYVAVHYIENIIPQIRCTQNYVEVDYTPSARNLTLAQPHDLGRGHSHDVRRTQLRKTSKVGDFGDGDNYLTMSGFEYSSAQTRMATLELMFQNGAPVTVAGLDDTALNTEYQIVDRTYTERAGSSTIYYEWTIKLRKT